MEFSFYALLPLLSAASLILLLIYIQRFHGLPAVQAFTILLLLSTAYAFTVALVILSQDMAQKIFWARIRLSTATFVSVYVLVTCVEFSTQGKKVPNVILAALSLIPVITIYLSLTASSLVYSSCEISDPFLVCHYGVWYWIYMVQTIGLEITAFAILWRGARHLPTFYARQHFWLLVGLFIPFLFEILYIFRIFPRTPGFNLSPALMAITAGTFAYAIVRFRIFDIMPIARHKVVETMQDAVIVTDAWQQVIDVNPAGRDLLRTYFQADPIIGLAIVSTLTSYSEWARCYSEANSSDLEVTFPDEKVYQVRVMPLTDMRHRRNGYMTLIHDISVRKRAEKALREREERLRVILDHLPVPVYMISANLHTLLYVNEAGAALARLPRQDMIGHPTRDFYVNAGDQERFIKALQKRKSAQGHSLLRREDGTVFPALMSGVTIDYAGEDVVLSGIVDLTAHQEVERRTVEIMSEREKVKALNSFIQSASHDFRTPISTIITSAYLIDKLAAKLVSRTDDPLSIETIDNLRAKAALIREGGDRLTRITNSMLDITRLDHDYQYSFESCDLNQIVDMLLDASQAAAQSKALTVHFYKESSLPGLQLDAKMMYRAIKELVDNAVYYTAELGHILIQTSITNSHVVLVICDSGIGIAEADLPYIFTTFFRSDKARSTKTGGAGLGLSIAKRIVDAHHGEIRVESVLGEGSCFNILLPIVQ